MTNLNSNHLATSPGVSLSEAEDAVEIQGASIAKAYAKPVNVSSPSKFDALGNVISGPALSQLEDEDGLSQSVAGPWLPSPGKTVSSNKSTLLKPSVKLAVPLISDPVKEGYIAYKAFKLLPSGQLQCIDMIYEPYQVYTMDCLPVLCSTGYHYCDKLEDVLNYYSMEKDTVFHKVRILGQYTNNGDDKRCTNSIQVLDRLTPSELFVAFNENLIKETVDVMNANPDFIVTGSFALMLNGKLPVNKISSVDFVVQAFGEVKNAEKSHARRGNRIFYTKTVASKKPATATLVSHNNSYSGGGGKVIDVDSCLYEDNECKKSKDTSNVFNFNLYVAPGAIWDRLELPTGQVIKVQSVNQIIREKLAMFSDSLDSNSYAGPETLIQILSLL